MTLIEELVAQVNAAGGRCWIEEILVRGAEDGTVKAAHLVFGYEHPGIGGSLIRNTVGPWPVSVSLADPMWNQVATTLNAQALDQINAQTTALASQAEQIDLLNADVNDKASQISTLTAEKESLQAQVEQLTADLEAALASKE